NSLCVLKPVGHWAPPILQYPAKKTGWDLQWKPPLRTRGSWRDYAVMPRSSTCKAVTPPDRFGPLRPAKNYLTGDTSRESSNSAVSAARIDSGVLLHRMGSIGRGYCRTRRRGRGPGMAHEPCADDAGACPRFFQAI